MMRATIILRASARHGKISRALGIAKCTSRLWRNRCLALRHVKWLHPPDPEFKTKVEAICQVYELTMEGVERGEMTFSVDEMTEIEALEHQMQDI